MQKLCYKCIAMTTPIIHRLFRKMTGLKRGAALHRIPIWLPREIIGNGVDRQQNVS